MINIVFFICGWLVHLIRDFDRHRNTTNSKEYLKKNSLKLIGSFILTLAILSILSIENNLDGITALTLGYTGESFFRYLLDKKFPYARF